MESATTENRAAMVGNAAYRVTVYLVPVQAILAVLILSAATMLRSVYGGIVYLVARQEALVILMLTAALSTVLKCACKAVDDDCDINDNCCTGFCDGGTCAPKPPE